MENLRLGFAGLMVAMLAGCTLAPEYSRPAAPAPAAWPAGAAYDAAKPAPEATPAADMPWREFLADARLQEVVEAALKNNRDLRLAALNVERARALYGVQRAELYPALQAVGSGTVERVPADLSSTGSARTAEQYSVNLGISAWEIDFFGRIRSLKDRALEEYLATDEARRDTQILLVSAVAGAYLALAADRETLSLAESTLQVQEEAYRLIRKRYDVGVASEIDLRRAQSQVDAVRADIARLVQITAQDENALNLLVGSSLPAELLPSTLADIRPLKEISAGLSSEILLRRPDVLAAEHRLKAADANIGAARAALFPRISLTTVIGTASTDLSRLFGSGQGIWAFAPQIGIPIFDARTWSAYDVTKVERELSVAQYEKSIQTAFREVADVLAVRGTVTQRISAQQSLVEAVAETYRLADLRYAKGIDSYLSVLDAQRTLYSAQQGLIALRFARIANVIALYQVLGGGA